MSDLVVSARYLAKAIKNAPSSAMPFVISAVCLIRLIDTIERGLMHLAQKITFNYKAAHIR